MLSFADWLSARKPDHEQFSIRRTGVTSDDMEEMVREWITRLTSPNGETLNREAEGPNLPVYVVDCPKLHVVPKKRLEYKLRWCDKWAYEVRPCLKKYWPKLTRPEHTGELANSELERR